MSDPKKRVARQLQKLTSASYAVCLMAVGTKLLRLDAAGHPQPMRACQDAAAAGDYYFFGLRKGID